LRRERVGATLHLVVSRQAPLSEEDELNGLVRCYPGLVHQLRVEDLGRRLRTRRVLPVAHCRAGLCGNRVQLWLDGDGVLRLWLYWPMHCRNIAALTSIGWYDKVGWVADLRTATGESARVFAYRAQLEHRPLTEAY
jgi:hypothetical protein